MAPMLAEEFARLGITSTVAQTERFNDFFARVNAPTSLELARNVTGMISNQLKVLRDPTPSPSAVDPKTFLSAFLCLTPDFLDRGREDERHLLQLAKDMVHEFEVLLGENMTDANRLALAWAAFAPTFESWQAGGTAAMLHQAAETYRDLVNARDHIRTNGFLNSGELLAAVDGRIRQLQDFVRGLKMSSSAWDTDPATLDVLNALTNDSGSNFVPASADNDKENIPPSPHAAPRTPMSFNSAEFFPPNSPLQAVNSRVRECRRLRGVAQLAHQSACNVQPQANASPFSYAPAERSVHDRSPALPASFFSNLAQVNGSAPPPTATVVDPFTMDPEHGQLAELRRMIRMQAERALWDLILRDLSLAEPQWGRLESVLTDMCDGLVLLCGSNANMAGEIRATLDWSNIKDNLSIDNLAAVVHCVVTTIAALDAPVREEDTRREGREIIAAMREVHSPAHTQVQRAQSIVTALKFLTAKLNTLKEEAAKCRMQMLVPYLREHAVEIERKWITAEIGEGMTLNKTSAWLNDSKSPSQNFTDEGLLNALRQGVLRLIQSHDIVAADKVPETLCLDVQNLAYLQQVVQCTVLIHCYEHIAKSVLAQSLKTGLSEAECTVLREAGAQAFRDQNVTMDGLCHMVSDTVAQILHARGGSLKLDDASIELLQRMIRKTSDTSDAVYKAYYMKLHKLLEATLLASVPANVQPFTVNEIKFLSSGVDQVCKFNAAVWKTHYHDLWRESSQITQQAPPTATPATEDDPDEL